MSPQDLAQIDPYGIPLDAIDVSNPSLYQQDLHWDYFKRLRQEEPVHYCADSPYGPYWSVTKYSDIMMVDSDYHRFSADKAVLLDTARLVGEKEDSPSLAAFIAMDPPEHDRQRKAVSPAVAPANLVRLASVIRERTSRVLDELPIGEEFDWVEQVSSELTILMLATLMDFPVQEKELLSYWSRMIAGTPGDGLMESLEQRDHVLRQCAARFLAMRAERAATPPANDLVSLLAHSPHARDMSVEDYCANIFLLIIGGNDTTRNSMSGGVLAFHDNPREWAKFRTNPALVDSLVPETIRFQTPVIYLARRARQDAEIRGKMIRKGDRIAMWYISGNRDEEAIENADRFIIDRARPRQHISFGFGIHRCLGNRLAELQLRILWEEIARRNWSRIEVTGQPVRAYSNAVRSIDHLPVRIHA